MKTFRSFIFSKAQQSRHDIIGDFCVDTMRAYYDNNTIHGLPPIHSTDIKKWVKYLSFADHKVFEAFIKTINEYMKQLRNPQENTD